MSASLTGQLASLGGNPPGLLLTGNYTVTASDDGRTIVIDGNGGNRTVTIPAGLPIGFTLHVYCNSSASNLTLQFSTPERIRQGGSVGSVAGTAVYSGATDTGYSVTIRKVSEGFAGTYWGTFGSTGALALT